jgi:hypothetical protein
MAKTWPAYNKW